MNINNLNYVPTPWGNSPKVNEDGSVIISGMFGVDGIIVCQGENGITVPDISQLETIDAVDTNEDEIIIYDASTASSKKAIINKSILALENVDNTSDSNKPISTATQIALNLKANIDTTATKIFSSKEAIKYALVLG